jgi:uroporphyrin-III C-methyltransferase
VTLTEDRSRDPSRRSGKEQGPVLLELPRPRFEPGSVVLVGGGPGAPDLVSLRALSYLTQADAVVYDRLVDPRVLRWAPLKARRLFVGKGPRTKAGEQDAIHRLLLKLARRGDRVVRWKGGDPFVYGRGFEELEFLRRHGITVRVIPGISSVTGALTAAEIPLVHRGVSDTFSVFPGRRARGLPEARDRLARLAQASDTLVGLMVVEELDAIVREISRVRSPQEPAALVVRGTTSSERVVRGTLRSIVSRARRAKVSPPALLVVGRVAALGRSLPRGAPSRARGGEEE